MKNEVENWFFFASKDIAAAEEIIKNPELTNIVAFHCQQAIEKYFKAYLLANNRTIIKTHDLITLMNMINEINEFSFDIEKIGEISELYIENRYPGNIGLLTHEMPTNEQAHAFLDFAKEVEKKIKDAMKEQ